MKKAILVLAVVIGVVLTGQAQAQFSPGTSTSGIFEKPSLKEQTNDFIGVGELQECTFKSINEYISFYSPEDNNRNSFGELQECTLITVQLDKHNILIFDFNSYNNSDSLDLGEDIIDYLDDLQNGFGEWETPMEVPFHVLQSELPEGSFLVKIK